MQGVANRDLKLENLLLDRDGSDGTRPLLKICDFGYSKVHCRTAYRTFALCKRNDEQCHMPTDGLLSQR